MTPLGLFLVALVGTVAALVVIWHVDREDKEAVKRTEYHHCTIVRPPYDWEKDDWT